MTTPDLRPRDFAVVLPPGWTRIGMDDDLGIHVVRLVNSQVEAMPAERRESARQTLTRALDGQLREARAAGATDVLLCRQVVRGVPLAATCIVSYQERNGSPLDALAGRLQDQGDDVSHVEVGGHPALRRVATRALPMTSESVRAVGTGSGLTAEQLAQVEPAVLSEVTWFVPVPEQDGLLVLSFGTPDRALAEPMTVLFDAIARTLRWVR